MSAAPPLPSDGTRPFLLALGFGALGALGVLPFSGESDPIVALRWIALLALPCGLACGGLALPPWPFAASVPALWMIAVALCGAASERAFGKPLLAALAWTGIFAAGWGIGRLARAGPRTVALGALLALGLSALPRLDARLADLSPVVVVLESAGVEARPGSAPRPWNGKLAGPGLFLLGCGLAALVAVRARARERPRA